MKKIILIALAACLGWHSQAREVIGTPPNTPGNIKPQGKYFYTMAAGCKQPAAQVDLDINNVRTTIMNGGDMWWNLVSAKYEVPKVTDPNGIRKHSIFAGALWIGGLDAGNNLKLAAMTYRQSGVDFFAGPLDTTDFQNPTIAEDRCDYHDRIYKVTRDEIDALIADAADGSVDKAYSKGITEWPGTGDTRYGESKFLAPFVDANNDGVYNFNDGDYPNVPGDQALWFVYNDKGNIHSETQGVPIGLELQTTAFAFTTNDEINNMTFYTTKITNFGEPVKETYFGQWIDPDLGNYSDDYVGCDTTRNLGYCYNGDDNDEGILGYGFNPPTVGLDFFQGPKDQNGKEIGLSYFVYYNNDFSNTGNPFRPAHFYNFLKGLWHDGSPITEGGTGVGGNTPTRYMFPGDPKSNTGWTEKQAGNKPADRRFLQTSGPFDLATGAVNEVTVGAVWAKASSGGATGSLDLLKLADDAAQKLFNNKFQLIEGPRAPDMAITEYDQGLSLVLNNTYNDKTEGYLGKTIGNTIFDTLLYKFQGYLVYQLKDAGVSASELRNPDVARLVAQVDIRDNISQLINKKFDANLKQYTYEEMVKGEDAGIKHVFKLTDDLFATGDKKLVNFKQYYYTVIAYANIINDPLAQENLQFLAGRKNVVTYKATPHKVLGKDNSQYRSTYAPMIKQLAGSGNGGNSLELSEESLDTVLKFGKVNQPVYNGGFGPVKIEVIDPTKLGDHQFELKLVERYYKSAGNKDSILNPKNTWWYMVDLKKPTDTIWSDTSLAYSNQQLLPQFGISITINQTIRPGNVTDEFDKTNGVLQSSIIWNDNSKKWLDGVEDDDVPARSRYNWIRSGVHGKSQGFSMTGAGAYEYDFGSSADQSMDPLENYERICDRKVAPFRLCARAMRDANGNVTYGPAFDKTPVAAIDNRLEDLASIDLVITSDRSKWTKCVVVEMCEDEALSEGGRKKWRLRNHASWTGNFDSQGNPIYDSGSEGFSYFPGYAVNVETGERLNIIFGEDSWLRKDNGADMLWNPTTKTEDLNGPVWGGKHHIFVCGAVKSGLIQGTTYDDGNFYFNTLKGSGNNFNPTDAEIRRVTTQVMWVMMPYLASGSVLDPRDIVPDGGDVRFRIRMSKPYTKISPLITDIGTPHYQFSTKALETDKETEALKSDLDLINIVPNPYYGYSQYENSQIDTRTRITNLPPKCTIRIYSINGTLIRTMVKDDPSTFVDWDLKNQAQVPVASGLYLININVPGLGERTIKWFGALRPVDLDTF